MPTGNQSGSGGGTFTNVSSRPPVVVPQISRLVIPHVSSGEFGNRGIPLTPREREARRLSRSASQQRTAAFGIDPVGGANTVMSGATSFFSPQLSTDFLELPQSLREKREIYRHYYNTDPLVGQAIDLHTELPLSKVRLAAPKPTTCPKGFVSADSYGRYILWFFETWSKKVRLLHNLITAVHHYWLDGSCLPPDEIVTVPGGVKLAEDVEQGDLVLTHQGRWRPVERVTQLHSSELVHVDVARLPDELRLTPEHPVEVMNDEGSSFVPSGAIKSGDWVKITWPVETQDVERVPLLAGVPDFVRPAETGYVITRTQTRPRTKEAARVRDYLLTWLAGLESPVMRSRADIAKAAGVEEHTLHNVILTLQEELPFPFRQRIPTGLKHGPHTLWLPIPPTRVNSVNYQIIREWEFRDAVTHIPVGDDFLYVLGYWLGDGSLVRDQSRSQSWGRGMWTISGADCSLESLARVEASLARMLGPNAIIRSTEDNYGEPLHVLRLRGNPVFIEWWAENFGATSHGDEPKKVPPWILALPADKQLSLMAGFIDSDGFIASTHVGGVGVGVTSLNIASAVWDVMLRLGAVPAMYKLPPRAERQFLNGHWVRANYPLYTVTVHTEEACRYLAQKSGKLARLDDAKRFFTSADSYRIRNDGVFFKVRGVRRTEGDLVYNFQVEVDSTFRAHFVSTHNCFIFAEDSTVEVPQEVGYEQQQIGVQSTVGENGETREESEYGWVERPDREDQELAYYQKHYKGWDKLIILPIDQIKITTYSFTDKVRIELIPSDRDRALIEQAKLGNDPLAEEMMNEIPEEVRDFISTGRLIPLGTDPEEGSFCYHLAGRRGAGEELGQSILDRCLRSLNFKEKLRQAQTQIASRAMTPKRIVWAEDISEADVEALREQVDLALVDPDYSIVANYEVHWEEMGSKDRLLDLSTEYETIDKQLRSGLGVTESLLSGESLYSGDRLKLEVINTRYLFLREILQEYVEEYLFKPVAKRKGFVEKNEWGEEVVLVPRLSFTRLPLRDSQDTFEALLNLYQKGSLSIDIILELFNIDPSETRAKLERDMFTVNDATFNEATRGIYGGVADKIIESTDVLDRIQKGLGLKSKAKDESAGNRF